MHLMNKHHNRIIDHCNKMLFYFFKSSSACQGTFSKSVCPSSEHAQKIWLIFQPALSYWALHKCTLEFLINVPVRLLISDQLSQQYALIRTSTFIFYEQLMILHTYTWPIFIWNCIFEPIILHQYVYLDQYVYSFWQNFPPVCLFGPVRLLGTLEYRVTFKEWTPLTNCSVLKGSFFFKSL